MEFGEHTPTSTPVNHPAYVQHLFQFANGYGASVINFGTWNADHWEYALIKATPEWNETAVFEIVFDHPDMEVAGYDMSAIEIGRILDRIKELKR